MGNDLTPYGHANPPPGYGPCTQDPGHEGPCAHPRLALSKEQAAAETRAALQQVYPDRWESIWDALGEESSADRAVAAAVEITREAPFAGVGAVIGGLIGAVVGPRRPTLAPKRAPFRKGSRRRRR